MKLPKIPRGVTLSFRILFGAGLLVYLLSRMDLRRILHLFSTIDLLFFLLAIFSYLIATIFATLRWKVLLRDSGIYLPFSKLLKIYLSSLFLGNFLPSGGLDLVRALAVSRISEKRASTFATVFLDRVLGFIAIFSFVILGFFSGVKALSPFRAWIFVLWILVITGFMIIFSRHFRRFLDRWIHRIPLGSRFFHLYEELHRFRGQWSILISALLLSFGVQFFYVSTAYLNAHALSQSVPFLKMLFFVTAINFIAMIPVTISGIGVREGGFVLLFSAYMTKEAALSLSLTYYITSVAVSIIGAFLILIGKSEIR